MNKLKISNDWINEFPQLKKKSESKFYEVLGPFITGIELIKLPRIDEYRPHFVVYSLWGNRWGNDLKSCLSGPIILQQYYNKIGRQLDIPYDKHDDFFYEVEECVNEQSPFHFGENVPRQIIYQMFEDYSKFSLINGSLNSLAQAFLQEEKLKTALFINDNEEAKNVFNYISKVEWNHKNFNYFGVDTQQWLNHCQELVEHPEVILQQVHHNKQEKEIKRLNSLQII